MRRLILAAALAIATPALAAPTPGETPAEAPAYKVIQSDARIPFSGSAVRGFHVGVDGSLILDAGSKWYRATLWAPCDRDLKWENSIALVTRPTDTLDRFAQVVVDGRKCPIHTLDRIEKPAKLKAKPAKDDKAAT